MDSFVIFLVMAVTVIGPSLVIGGLVFGIPITLLVLAARGEKLTAKVVLITLAATLCIPIVMEVIAVVTLLVLFQLFGKESDSSIPRITESLSVECKAAQQSPPLLTLSHYHMDTNIVYDYLSNALPTWSYTFSDGGELYYQAQFGGRCAPLTEETTDRYRNRLQSIRVLPYIQPFPQHGAEFVVLGFVTNGTSRLQWYQQPYPAEVADIITNLNADLRNQKNWEEYTPARIYVSADDGSGGDGSASSVCFED